MDATKKHIEGFTLAELLIVVAIVVILAAIAIPSIMAAQSNLRMLELNNAADQIANAAQTQMTAKKVSGTWWSTIQKGGTDDHAADCKYPEATNAPKVEGRTLYYMTAQEAQQAGIVPSLSIDEDVRAGQYVIEFDADTASVARVFYADGKPGFFGSANPEAAKRVYTYYDAGGGSTDPGVRRASPMIGLYEGTPAGATPAVALKNPVISMDEATGRLWVQDPNINITKADAKDTSTVLVLTKQDTPAASFQIAGLSYNTNAIDVSLASDVKVSVRLSGDTVKDIVSYVDKNTGQPTGNVCAIDLTALVRGVQGATASSNRDAVLAVLDQFAPADKVKVDATTKLVSSECIPAAATAYIEWPAPVGKLTLMVTDPYSLALAQTNMDDANNADYLHQDSYTAPTVQAITTSGMPPVNGIEAQSVFEDNPLKSTTANALLIKQNKQAGWQSYSGGWISLSDANQDITLRLRAAVGAYQGTARHSYQVWELWARQANGNLTRTGYLDNGTWVWASAGGVSYRSLEQCLTWYDAQGVAYDSLEGLDTDALNIVSVEIGNAQKDNLNAVLDGLGLMDEEGNASIYVRTAPKMSEVQAYFNDKATSGALKQEIMATNGRYGKVGSRGSGAGLLTTARQSFESEFGASSSDVSWVITPDEKTGFDQGNKFITGSDVRVYYSIAPGVGFPNIKSNGNYLRLRSTEMTNVALWLYRDVDGTLQTQPAALVQRDAAVPYYCEGGQASVADFELKTNCDYLFYRVLAYYDQDGATELKPSQYIPHIVQNDARYATIAAGESKPAENLVFTGWETVDTGTGEPLKCEVGKMLGDYDSQLAWPGTNLLATYIRASVGLLYLEFNDAGSVAGYHGYLSGDGELVSQLPTDNDIASWGYYLVVPEGADDPKRMSGSVNLTGDAQTVNIGASAYTLRAFKLKTDEGLKKANQTVTYKSGVESGTFTFNLNFAAAVTQGSASVTWGQEDSPWKVRHALQFPGALSWYGNASTQAAYRADCFLQEHDLDMDDAPAGGAMTFNQVFAGVYDGGAEQGLSVYHVGSRLSKEVNHRLGLFPIIDGATIRNVAIRFDAEENIAVRWNASINASFGMLVGYARGGTIEKCSVAPEADASEARLQLGVSNLNRDPNNDEYGNGNSIGVLVGLAEGASVAGCSAQNVDLTVAGSGTWLSPAHRFGGLVGFIDLSGSDTLASGFLDDLTVGDGTLSVSTMTDPARGRLSLGAIAGRLSSSDLSIGGWSATSLLLSLPDGQDDALALVGGFVGEATVETTSFSSYTISGVVLSIGEAETSLDDKLIGNAP